MTEFTRDFFSRRNALPSVVRVVNETTDTMEPSCRSNTSRRFLHNLFPPCKARITGLRCAATHFFLQGLNEADVSRNRSGTSINLGGDFALSFNGARSQYLPSNASARDVKLGLEALDTVGTVDVERYDGDEEVSQAREGQERRVYRVLVSKLM